MGEGVGSLWIKGNVLQLMDFSILPVHFHSFYTLSIVLRILALHLPLKDFQRPNFDYRIRIF